MKEAVLRVDRGVGELRVRGRGQGTGRGTGASCTTGQAVASKTMPGWPDAFGNLMVFLGRARFAKFIEARFCARGGMLDLKSSPGRGKCVPRGYL